MKNILIISKANNQTLFFNHSEETVMLKDGNSKKKIQLARLISQNRRK